MHNHESCLLPSLFWLQREILIIGDRDDSRKNAVLRAQCNTFNRVHAYARCKYMFEYGVFTKPLEA